MWLLRSSIDLARHCAWSAVTRDTPGGLVAVKTTRIAPEIIKRKNLSGVTSAPAALFAVLRLL